MAQLISGMVRCGHRRANRGRRRQSGSLADGYWQLAIPSVGYLSPLNSPSLRRLFGDLNNDGTIDGATDFAAFGNDYGRTVANSPFDFNNDGAIDGPVDFAEFGARFGLTV